LPIEHQVEKTMGRAAKALDARAFRQACRDFALAQVDVQRADFKRLGVHGQWDDPYLTLSAAVRAEQLRAFAQIIRNGHLYKGYKPVHWCLTAALRWRRPKSSTRSASRPPSTCASG
jgi:isoleucyl-tRNA synthetase